AGAKEVAPTPLVLRGVPEASVRSDAAVAGATLQELKATASSLDATLLLYWVGDDAIVSWALAPDGTLGSAVVPVRRPRLDALARATAAFTVEGGEATTTTRGGEAIPLLMKPRPEWTELYDLLIEPLSRWLPSAGGARLVVVPHGPLVNVAFAALRDPHG